MKQISSIDVTEIRQSLGSSWLVIVHYADGDFEVFTPFTESEANNLVETYKYVNADIVVHRFAFSRKGSRAFIVAPEVEDVDIISMW